MTVSETTSETTEAFGDRIVKAIDSASLAILLSVGHQTGLLDTMAGLRAVDQRRRSPTAAGLNERYVREWLGGMTAGAGRRVRRRTQPLTRCRPTARRC